MKMKKTIKKSASRGFPFVLKTFVIIACLLVAGAFLTLGGNVVVKDGQLNVTNDFFVSTDVLFVDSAGSKVGIGTTGPDASLEVINSTNKGGFMVSSAAEANGDLFIVDEAGNVGIGTTNPSQELEVAGDINVTGTGIYFPDGSLQTAADSGIPSGVIVMWSGTYNNIPSGWHLCDGTSGTPDLRNRFIYGVNTSYGAGNDGDLNTTGGSSAHSHTASSSGAGGHTHAYTDYTIGSWTDMNGIRVAQDYETQVWSEYITINQVSETSGAPNWCYLHSYAKTTATSEDHQHQITVNSTITIPPYYKLAYIMKL